MNWPPKTPEDIHGMIAQHLEEAGRIEFKQQLPPTGSNDSIARAITAMVNANGGVIVYGIEEANGAATGLVPFDTSGVADRIDLVAKTIDEPVSPISVYPIATADSEGVLVVELARSSRAPHFYKGVAHVRSARTTTYLSRREAGERFARSPGFAQEFGLSIGRPGRVRFEVRIESQLSPGGFSAREYFWIFENDGDVEVHDANWHLVPDEPALTLHLLRDPFPRAVFHAGERLVLLVTLTMGGAPPEEIATEWVDLNGERHEMTWAITWA